MKFLSLFVVILLVVGPTLSQETQTADSKPEEESPGLLERIRRQAKLFFNKFTTTTTTTTQRTINVQLVGGGLTTGTGTGPAYYIIDYGNGVARRVRARNGRGRRRRINIGGRRARRGGRIIRVG